jgi:N-methylhydantoinase A
VSFRVGVDIGGTFTDCAIVADGGAVYVGKVPSTPYDFSDGFFASIRSAAEETGLEYDELIRSTSRVAHGTTVGINALVTRSGARVGLLTTRGHRDALKIMDNTGRVTGASVEEMLDYAASSMPVQFVEPRFLREVTERIDADGDVVVTLDEDAARDAIAELIAVGVDAVAISLLWSFLNPKHEQRLAELVKQADPSLFVSSSHLVAPRIDEYRRTATTVFNAYIGPAMNTYISRISDRVRTEGYDGEILFATTTGGLVDESTAREIPILTLQSGPVGGVVATQVLTDQCALDDVITSDMGGTTLDVGVVAGRKPIVRTGAVIERHHLHLRMVDVDSIGAGGGSIAWFEPVSKTLRVGPQSAGADPGPACYGRGGTAPTVTDADLVLGILNPDGLLGGRMILDLDAAERAIDSLADELGIDRRECAAGIVEIVDSRMEDLLRRMTIQRGLDPRDFVLFGYGGGAAAHASLYGRGLGLSRLMIPLGNVASVWSAVGVAMADIARTYEQAVHLAAPLANSVVASVFDELEARARADLSATEAPLTITRTAEMRYGLQVFEVESAVPAGNLRSDQAMHEMVDNFERAYADRYGAGSGYREAGVILSALRVEARVEQPRPSLSRPLPSDPAGPTGTRSVYWYELESAIDTSVYAVPALAPGTRIDGPAIVECPDTTVVVRPGQFLTADEWGNLIVELNP